MLDVLHELLNLALHFFHALAHLQDDGDPADVDAQIARERQDELEALQIFIRIEPGVAFGAARFQQPFAFIEAQGLGMNLLHLGDGRDHVRAFGFTFGHPYATLTNLGTETHRQKRTHRAPIGSGKRTARWLAP